MRRLLLAVAAAAVAVLLLALSGAAFGHAPGDLLGILVTGSVGSRFAFEGTLLKSVPLLLTGLSVAVAFRAGVWNIGAEGQFIVGALAGLLASRWGVVASLLAAMLAGAAWSSLATVMRLWRNAPEVLTTILLNFTAIHLLGWSVNGPLRERVAQYPQSDPAGASLPLLAGQLHAGIVVALAASVALWWLIHRTKEGLRLRATGYNPNAARWAGVNVRAQLARAMAISGAVAGLAGGIELLGVTHRLFERFASGYGYSGIAVALLAQLHPLATVLSAIFFGALVTGAGELQRTANISAAVAVLGQAVVILTLIAFDHARRRT
ncbi:MAG TPA: ABC transporter permease [Thermoanaerobaculia bacterium]